MTGEDPRSDAELLAATPGDADAFAVFYRRHVPMGGCPGARRTLK
jgi:hypothetical protein